MTACTLTFDESRRYFENRLGRSFPARNSVSALCPFHGDTTESLSLNLAKGVWKCHACNIGGGLLDFEHKKTAAPIPECWTAIYTTIGRDAPKASKPKRGRIVAAYDYHDAAGNAPLRLLPLLWRARPGQYLCSGLSPLMKPVPTSRRHTTPTPGLPTAERIVLSCFPLTPAIQPRAP